MLYSFVFHCDFSNPNRIRVQIPTRIRVKAVHNQITSVNYGLR